MDERNTDPPGPPDRIERGIAPSREPLVEGMAPETKGMTAQGPTLFVPLGAPPKPADAAATAKPVPEPGS